MPETITAPPATTMPATTAAPPPPVDVPAPDKQKLADPFAELKLPPKEKAAPDKKDDKATAATTAPKTESGKTTAVRKDPIREQRERIEQQNKTIADTTRERDELRQKLAALEARGGGDTAAMTKLVDELKQKNAQLSGEISARDYSKSEEFQTKYGKPFDAAANYAKNVIESLQVTDADGNSRDAKWETDFAPIYQLPRGAALRQAKALFGEDTNAIASVMSQYDELHKLQFAKDTALTEWQKGADEREQKQRAESLVRQQNIEKAFDMVTKNYMENDAEFQVKPDDKDLQGLWDKSQALVDKTYFSRDKLAPHELILLDAAVRLRAINEPVLRAKLARAMEELAEYKARFEEKEASKNGDTRRTTAATETAEQEDWQKELKEKLAAAG